ncbi:bidirectional sugar transporter N3-like [Vigna unguiculata]|uniref:Bidirectional sugar transporter SWEET n=1 Tax=Vigna unguiculata TaxID=3917 RepID=A0A4D6KGQ9_VIGUN|nr:bidirectional sugar transporter N3-like [Vigna unguiculata]QCD76498.1 SWEET sugar transporter [Vigna unguiculata]
MAILGSHNPLAATFGILGNIISVMVYLAPARTFQKIYKKKSTQSFQSLPYLVALFSSSLWLFYASFDFKHSLLIITINSFGCVTEIIYILIFVKYADRDAKNLTIKLFAVMNLGCLASIVLVVRCAVDQSKRVLIIGWICDVVSVIVFASPLSVVFQVIRTKSVQFMPFCLSFSLLLNAIMWLAYGLFNKDMCVAMPNVGGLALGLLQMLLHVIYRKRGATEEVATEDAVRTIVVVMNPLGPAEVFPIAVKDEHSEGGEDDAEGKTVEANDCPL